MDHPLVKEAFLDMVEETLPAELKAEVSSHLESCPDCNKAFNEYRAITHLERIAAAELPVLDEDLSVGVMNALDQHQTREMVSEEFEKRTRRLIGSLVSINMGLIVAILVLLSHQHWDSIASSISALTNNTQLAAVDPAQLIVTDGTQIPEGYRPVTLTIDPDFDVRVLTEPNKRVDVHWIYVKNGKRRIETIGNYLKIHSVRTLIQHNSTGLGEQETSVTLLAPEEEAKEIQIARVVGATVLSVLNTDNGKTTPATPADTTTLFEITGQPAPAEVLEELSPETFAVMYSYDWRTGKRARYIFDNGTWQPDNNIELIAF